MEKNQWTSVIKIGAVALTAMSVLFVTHIPELLGISSYLPVMHQAVFLAIILFLAFLIYPARKMAGLQDGTTGC